MFHWERYRGYRLRIWTTGKSDVFYGQEFITSISGAVAAREYVDQIKKEYGEHG